MTTGGTFSGEYYTPTNPLMKQACKVAYFGWYSKYGKYADYSTIFAHKYEYVFTQQYIWEVTGQSSATFRDETVQSQYVEFKKEIESKIEEIKKQPSFSGSLVVLDIGETITLTDTNEVLKDYATIDKTVNGITIIHKYGENTMEIKVNNDCITEEIYLIDEIMKNWGLIKKRNRRPKY